jgi:hypothetical protein
MSEIFRLISYRSYLSTSPAAAHIILCSCYYIKLYDIQLFIIYIGILFALVDTIPRRAFRQLDPQDRFG